MVDLRAWDRARAIGAVEEAETLGSRVVGTEHLLLATLAEPTVRWALRTVGVDRPGLQAEVARIGPRRRRPSCELITEDASDAVTQAGDISDALDVDEPTRDQVGRMLRLLVHRFLVRSKTSEARDVLDRLGVVAARKRVLATIEHNARPSQAPPPEPAAAHLTASGRGHPRALRLLGHQSDPGPFTG